MEARGQRKPPSRGLIISLVIIAASIAVVMLIDRYSRPSTDNASIDADVVHVAAAVGGRVIDLPIRENAHVRKGDLLFQIDPVPYRIAVEMAAANVDVALAALDSQQRLVASQRSGAAVASEQTLRAEANLGLTTRTEERLRPLTADGYVPKQQLDQAQVARHDAATALRQVKEQAAAARRAVDNVAGAAAAVQAAKAALANAKRALDDTTVRAAHDGRIVGLTISTGEMTAPSQALFTLVNTEEWFAVANIRETDLHAIATGDCATVYSMIDRRKAIKGVVQGIGWGVLSDDRVNLPRSVPLVQRSLNWVRVAQRFPVRVRLEAPPEALARLGASANVEIGHGAACH